MQCFSEYCLISSEYIYILFILSMKKQWFSENITRVLLDTIRMCYTPVVSKEEGYWSHEWRKGTVG